MRRLAESAEREKLKAIGQRMKLQMMNNPKLDIRRDDEDMMTAVTKTEAKEKQGERNKSSRAASMENGTSKTKTGGVGQRRTRADWLPREFEDAMVDTWGKK